MGTSSPTYAVARGGPVPRPLPAARPWRAELVGLPQRAEFSLRAASRIRTGTSSPDFYAVARGPVPRLPGGRAPGAPSSSCGLPATI
jgi:hypothetical protein